MIVQEYKHRVIYGDTDAMGVIYYANYLRIYEAARADFLDKIGLSLTDIVNQNVICPIININVDYITPAKYDWITKIVSTVEKVPAAKLIFKQEMYSPDNVLLNRATITLGFVNSETFRPIRCPEWIREGFETHFKTI
jgi:acyl-CoA thioester hydrolase